MAKKRHKFAFAQLLVYNHHHEAAFFDGAYHAHRSFASLDVAIRPSELNSVFENPVCIGIIQLTIDKAGLNIRRNAEKSNSLPITEMGTNNKSAIIGG